MSNYLESESSPLPSPHHEPTLCATEGAPLSVIVAAGPFTAADSLAFEPLDELLESASTGRAPDALVLMGPFVDVEHSMVADGSLPVTFEQLFAAQASFLTNLSISSSWYSFSRHLRIHSIPLVLLYASCILLPRRRNLNTQVHTEIYHFKYL